MGEGREGRGQKAPQSRGGVRTAEAGGWQRAGPGVPSLVPLPVTRAFTSAGSEIPSSWPLPSPVWLLAPSPGHLCPTLNKACRPGTDSDPVTSSSQGHICKWLHLNR